MSSNPALGTFLQKYTIGKCHKNVDFYKQFKYVITFTVVELQIGLLTRSYQYPGINIR